MIDSKRYTPYATRYKFSGVWVIIFLLLLSPLLHSEMTDGTKSSETTQPAPSAPEGAAPNADQPAGKVKPEEVAPKKTEDEFDKLRDPFESSLPTAPIPTVTKKTKQAKGAAPISAVLEGISISSKGARAVISGEIFDLNQEKNGIIVTQIRKKEVDILINGVSETLRLFELDEGMGSKKVMDSR